MKALAIDSATTKLTIAAKNDDKTVTVSYDIGMKQSETLLPAIQYILEKVELTPTDLDYTAICEGPGSFTGLRLGFSALKAFQTANKTPIYGISTLKVYANPLLNLGKPVVSVIDAKKDRFYACGFCSGKCSESDSSTKCLDNFGESDSSDKRTESDSLAKCSGSLGEPDSSDKRTGGLWAAELFPSGDYKPEKITEFIKDEKEVFVAGFDAEIFIEAARQFAPNINFTYLKNPPAPTDSLFDLAEEKIKNNEPPLKDFDGPVYLRASEAEVKLENKSN